MGGLYPLSVARRPHQRSSLSAIKVPAAQWHRRLGHPAHPVVNSILRTYGFVLDSNKDESVCDACQQAKIHQFPFQNSVRKSTCPLELIHSDVWGPAIKSVGGFQYYISFIGDFSRHT